MSAVDTTGGMQSCPSWTTQRSISCLFEPELSPTDEQKAGLKAAYAHVAMMAERVRKPRGRMAEPVLTYGFAEEDLA